MTFSRILLLAQLFVGVAQAQASEFDRHFNQEGAQASRQYPLQGFRGNEINLILGEYFTFNPQTEDVVELLVEHCGEGIFEGITEDHPLESTVRMEHLELERAAMNTHKINREPISRSDRVPVGAGEVRAIWFEIDYRGADNQVSLTHLGVVSRDGARAGILGDPENWGRGITIPRQHELVICVNRDFWSNISHFGVGAGAFDGDGSRPVLQMRSLDVQQPQLEQPGLIRRN